MAPISFPRKGSRLLTLVPAFYVLKEQRGKRALVRASVWRFNGSSKGFAPARPQVVEQQTSGLAVLGSHEGKPSGLWAQFPTTSRTTRKKFPPIIFLMSPSEDPRFSKASVRLGILETSSSPRGTISVPSKS